MQVKSKIFPYPILNNDKLYSNFKDAYFEMVYESFEDDTAYILKNLHFSTNSDLINDLYESGKIVIKLVIECPETVYRKAFDVCKEPRNVRLRKVDFTEKVDVSMFACAIQDFKMSSDEFEEDYNGIDFEIEKYDIICANDGFNIRFKHDESESNLVKSIFSVIPSEGVEENTYEVNSNLGKKITISLSENEYKNFKIVNTVPLYKEIVFNMLLVPSLIDALTLCKKDSDTMDLDDLGNKYIWFRSIVASYLRLKGQELTIEEFRNCSPILLAQQLLGKPMGEALDKIVKEATKIEGDVDNE